MPIKGMKPMQLTIFEEMKKQEEAEKPYRNGMGELLPWEEPKYINSKANRHPFKNYERFN